MIKRLGIILLSLFLFISLTACSNKHKDVVSLSFKSASSYEKLKELNNKTVTINGFMATSSPVDGSFIFLMNLPYQNCPFCKPNTQELSNTMEVYPKKNETFGYTNQAIKVTGKLVVSDDKNKPFTDSYGYEFNFKIVDAEYKILKESEMTSSTKMYQKIASTSLISDIYSMYDYLNFVANWPSYFVNNHYDSSGNLVKGYYLYAEDAKYFIKTDGAQWNFGYKEGYFDNLISRIEALDKNAYKDLVENIKQAKEFNDYALNELFSENYTKEYKYVEKFDKEDYIYRMNNESLLNSKLDTIYYSFTDWISSFEF